MAQYGEQLNCHQCDETLRKERGHDEEGIVPFLVEGKRVFRCPLTFITPLSWEYIKAFKFYEKGCFPNGVVYTRESNKYLQAMMILDNLFTERMNKEYESAGNRSNHPVKGYRPSVG